MTLEEDVRKLAALRQHKAEIDERIKASREAWMDENAEKILAASVAGDHIAELEEKIRAAAVAEFLVTGNKKPAPGVGIKEVKEVRYDPSKAFEWAKGVGFYISFDKKGFEKGMTGAAWVPEFVEVVKVPQATIARKLEE